jgi:hypothetical protein
MTTKSDADLMIELRSEIDAFELGNGDAEHAHRLLDQIDANNGILDEVISDGARWPWRCTVCGAPVVVEIRSPGVRSTATLCEAAATLARAAGWRIYDERGRTPSARCPTCP